MIRRHASSALLAVFAIGCSIVPGINFAGDCSDCPAATVGAGCPSGACPACAESDHGDCKTAALHAGSVCTGSSPSGCCEKTVEHVACAKSSGHTSTDCDGKPRPGAECAAHPGSGAECPGEVSGKACGVRAAIAALRSDQLERCASQPEQCAGGGSECATKCDDAAKGDVATKCGAGGKVPCVVAEEIIKIKDRLEARVGRATCPGLSVELELETGDDGGIEARRAQMIEVLRNLDAEHQEEEEVLPTPEEVAVGERLVSRGQSQALRAASSSLERTAAILEGSELDDEADLVRHLADELRREARQAVARLRQSTFMSAAPSPSDNR